MNFKDKTFFIVYDVGYGEKGIHESFLDFDGVKKYIADRYEEYKVNDWIKQEDDYYELDFYGTYIIGVDDGGFFDFDEWSGSQDY